MLKNFFNEIAPLFDLDIIIFLLIKLGTWCVLLNNLVPISLLMTLELVKYFQGFFISWDIDIYDKKKKVTTKVQTSTLNEELGQIKYIFTDKTGTLTKNQMNFKMMSIGIDIYGSFDNNETNNNNNLLKDEYGDITNVDFYDINNSFKNDLNDIDKKEKINI